MRATRRISGRVGPLVGQFLLAIWLMIVVVPLAAAVISSVKSNTDMYSDPLGLHLNNIEWGNFLTALKGPVGGLPLWDYLKHSGIAVFCSIVIGVSLGVLAAYGLARSGGRLSAVMTRTFTVLLTIPIMATFVPLFNLMSAFRLTNSAFGISFVYAAFMLPPTVLLMRPYFAAIPAEMIEAAELDGASQARTFLQVVLPVAFPTILGVIVINVIWVWSELQLGSVLLVSADSKTLPVGLLAFQGQFATNLGVQGAGLFLGAAPMVLIYFIFSRRITEGLQAGIFR